MATSFKPLTPEEVALRKTPARQEYIERLAALEAGAGGTIDVKKEGVTRQTVKNRVKQAAKALGAKVKFIRSPKSRVDFEVVKAASREMPSGGKR